MFSKALDKYRDIGLLILRIGIGGMMIFHGAPKMFGGPERWEGTGKAMAVIGINFLPVLWGFLASFAEFAGGIFIIFGLFFRPMSFMIFFTMLIASLRGLSRGNGLRGAAHAIEVGIVFLSLIFIGPGKYSLDEMLKKRKNKLEAS